MENTQENKMTCPKCGSEMRYQSGDWWSGYICIANEKKSFGSREQGHDVKVKDGNLVAFWNSQPATGVRYVDEHRHEDRDDMGVLSSTTGHDEG